MPAREKGRSFPFHKHIIEGGNWSQLNPTAMALYPAMRYFGYFDEEELLIDEKMEAFQDFSARSHDFCCAEIQLLVKYAGITRSSVSKALGNLVENYLIEESDSRFNKWKVFLHPPKYFKRDFLNKKIMSVYSQAA